MLLEAIRAGLVAGGRTCLDAGVAATPTTGILVREQGAAGGIQISASHNPRQYNGIKLISDEGRAISAAQGAEVIAHYRRGSVQHPTHVKPGSQQHIEDSTTGHLEKVLAVVDAEKIRARGFRVVLDSNHGSGSLLGRRLLEALGCETIVLGPEPDGDFEHLPEPTEENLQRVFGAVTEHRAQIGFCQDPDADRLAFFDEQGRYPGEEYTVALCVDHVLRTRQGSVVINCSTSRMSEDIARRHAAQLHRSAVGEVNVVDKMLATDAVIGGEGNGGVIDPRVGLIRDSFVTMALLLEAMAIRNVSIGEMAAELPRYAIVKTKISMPPDRVAAALDALAARFSDATAERMDGLRLDWPDRWLLVRASNTEPIVRAVAEAPGQSDARQLCDEAAAVLSNV